MDDGYSNVLGLAISPSDAVTAIPIDSMLIDTPFFDAGSGEYADNLFTADSVKATLWLATDDNRWRVLAGTVPARSLSIGHVPGGLVSSEMPGSFKSNWRSRLGYGSSWLHSDIKNMAYALVYLFFDDIASNPAANLNSP